MNVMGSQITRVSIVCSNVCSGADKRKHKRSVPLAFVRGIHLSVDDVIIKQVINTFEVLGYDTHVNLCDFSPRVEAKLMEKK